MVYDDFALKLVRKRLARPFLHGVACRAWARQPATHNQVYLVEPD